MKKCFIKIYREHYEICEGSFLGYDVMFNNVLYKDPKTEKVLSKVPKHLSTVKARLPPN